MTTGFISMAGVFNAEGLDICCEFPSGGSKATAIGTSAYIYPLTTGGGIRSENQVWDPS